MVTVVNRQYPSLDGDGTTVSENVRVIIEGGEADTQETLCDLAVEMAGPVAEALPDA
jgi:hypothetical protein